MNKYIYVSIFLSVFSSIYGVPSSGGASFGGGQTSGNAGMGQSYSGQTEINGQAGQFGQPGINGQAGQIGNGQVGQYGQPGINGQTGQLPNTNTSPNSPNSLDQNFSNQNPNNPNNNPTMLNGNRQLNSSTPSEYRHMNNSIQTSPNVGKMPNSGQLSYAEYSVNTRGDQNIPSPNYSYQGYGRSQDFYYNPNQNPPSLYYQNQNYPNQNYQNQYNQNYNQSPNYQNQNYQGEYNQNQYNPGYSKINQNNQNIADAQMQNNPNQYGNGRYDQNAATSRPMDVKSDSRHPNDRSVNDSDREMNKKIRDKITGWVTDDYENIVINSSNGRVTIDGYVDTDEARTYLVDQVRKIQPNATFNVQIRDKNVANEKATQKYSQDKFVNESDRQINIRIRDKISGWFTDDYKNIVLVTNNGIVTLEGYVTSDKALETLLKDVGAVQGVKNVKSNVTVRQ